jgi:hypothetical protein
MGNGHERKKVDSANVKTTLYRLFSRERALILEPTLLAFRRLTAQKRQEQNQSRAACKAVHLPLTGFVSALQ